jgi:hypothetical protein
MHIGERPAPRFGAASFVHNNCLYFHGGDGGGKALGLRSYQHNAYGDFWKLCSTPNTQNFVFSNDQQERVFTFDAPGALNTWTRVGKNSNSNVLGKKLYTHTLQRMYINTHAHAHACRVTS